MPDQAVTREKVRPAQIQYQLLMAQMGIGTSFASADDAPEGVLRAMEHIDVAMNLLEDPDIPLGEAKEDIKRYTKGDFGV